MSRKLIFTPYLYTETETYQQIIKEAEKEFGKFVPLFLDPTGCAFNANLERVKKAEKENKLPIICFANFTSTLKEYKLWRDNNTKKWNIYFWCKDNKIRHVQSLTNHLIQQGTDIEKLYKEDTLNEFNCLK